MFGKKNKALLRIRICDLQNRIVCRAGLLEDDNLPADQVGAELGLQFFSDQPIQHLNSQRGTWVISKPISIARAAFVRLPMEM